MRTGPASRTPRRPAELSRVGLMTSVRVVARLPAELSVRDNRGRCGRRPPRLGGRSGGQIGPRPPSPTGPCRACAASIASPHGPGRAGPRGGGGRPGGVPGPRQPARVGGAAEGGRRRRGAAEMMMRMRSAHSGSIYVTGGAVGARFVRVQSTPWARRGRRKRFRGSPRGQLRYIEAAALGGGTSGPSSASCYGPVAPVQVPGVGLGPGGCGAEKSSPLRLGSVS